MPRIVQYRIHLPLNRLEEACQVSSKYSYSNTPKSPSHESSPYQTLHHVTFHRSSTSDPLPHPDLPIILLPVFLLLEHTISLCHNMEPFQRSLSILCVLVRMMLLASLPIRLLDLFRSGVAVNAENSVGVFADREEMGR